MPTTDTASQLRERARALRRLAASAREAESTRLWRRAGVDTWVGPVAQACLDDLCSIARRLRSAADDLDSQARRLDTEADAAELAARVVRT